MYYCQPEILYVNLTDEEEITKKAHYLPKV